MPNNYNEMMKSNRATHEQKARWSRKGSFENRAARAQRANKAARVSKDLLTAAFAA